MEKTLFDRQSVSDYCEAKTKDLITKIKNLSDKEIVCTELEEWEKYYFQEYEIQPLAIIEDFKDYKLTETQIRQKSPFFTQYGQPKYFSQDAYKIIFNIYFEGDYDLFFLIPSTIFISIQFEYDQIIKPIDKEYGILTLSMIFSKSDFENNHDNLKDYVEKLFRKKFSYYQKMVTIQSPENLYRCTKKKYKHPIENNTVKKVKNGMQQTAPLPSKMAAEKSFSSKCTTPKRR